MKWIASWLDPVSVLSPGLTAAAIAVSGASLEDMTHPTVVGGFIQVSGNIFNVVDPAGASAGYLIMGLRILPETLTTVADTPDPFNEDEGDWFWYRSFPLLNLGNAFNSDGSASFMVNDQIRSKRKIAEDEQVVLVYTMLDADAAAQDAAIYMLASMRLLFREA